MPLTAEQKRQADALVSACNAAVNALLLAQVYAEVTREKVDKIERQVLADEEFFAQPRLPKGQRGPRFRVTEPKDAWLMEEDHFLIYHKRLQAIHLDNGFADAAKGYCPALVAEGLVSDCERLLIECAEPLFPGMTNHRLLCAGLDKRKEYLDLLVKLVVNAPNYRKVDLPKPVD